MFFELRQYRMKPGKSAEWVKMMDDEIIPFQASKGMVIVGSFTSPEEEDLYTWIRRFESEEEREALYAAVYQSDYWKNDLSPRVGDLIDREQIKVTRITPTPKSIIR
ncbi:MAG: NIPSNAP family protein [Caldilineaceae bacterium]|nr:NIPSNAP family protein [Caldilineaceae bacterium]MCB0089905.1 NIPSNAP family protein [Caldilineaceae bacterium]MCB0138977.1 NIPSNAP family protein [Caldilineaceae bacterium]